MCLPPLSARAGECWGGPGSSVSLALEALADCRDSCKLEVEERGEVPHLVKLLGGVGDNVTDPFGVEMEVRDGS